MNILDKQSIIENKIVKHQALTYDDVLLLPNYADIKRQDVDLTSVLHPKIVLKLPVLSSPMDTVTEERMAIAMARSGGLGVIHRNMTVEAQADLVAQVKAASIDDTMKAAVDGHGKLLVAAAVGVGKDLESRIQGLVSAGVDVLVVDSAHGHSKFIIEAVGFIKTKYSDMVVMAGNVATYDGARSLIEAGTDIIRVGMGPGSICTTRIITGMGVPQISAVSAAVRATNNTKVTVIADGGIKQIGDMAKALAFGASSVMLGSMLARYDESPGESVDIDGKKFKTYRGMGSVAAMKKGGAERYGQTRNTEDKKLIAEGVEALVEYQGSVTDFLFQVEGSLRSSFYYLGSKTLAEFFAKSRVIKISTAGLLESHPHSVVISEAGGNYQVKK